MRLRPLAAACVLAAAHALAGAQTPAGAVAATPLTLAETMRLAEASTLLANNPDLRLERSDMRTRVAPPPDERSKGWIAGIAQPFEIGGQQALRRQAAAAALEALRAEIEAARRQVRGGAALRFQAVLAARRRIQIEQRSADLFDSTAQAVAIRRAAGEDTRLDSNVAVVEAERARNALSAAREGRLDARAALASALQLAPAALPEVSGDLAATTSEPLPYALDQLVTSTQARSSLRAVAAGENAAQARLECHATRIELEIAAGWSLEGSAR